MPEDTLVLLTQLFWPDDKMWYLVEIHSILPKMRTAKCGPPASVSKPVCVHRVKPGGYTHVAFLCRPSIQDILVRRIQYTSGEIEELDLEEIIREGHMSLITQ